MLSASRSVVWCRSQLRSVPSTLVVVSQCPSGLTERQPISPNVASRATLFLNGWSPATDHTCADNRSERAGRLPRIRPINWRLSGVKNAPSNCCPTTRTSVGWSFFGEACKSHNSRRSTRRPRGLVPRTASQRPSALKTRYESRPSRTERLAGLADNPALVSFQSRTV